MARSRDELLAADLRIVDGNRAAVAEHEDAPSAGAFSAAVAGDQAVVCHRQLCAFTATVVDACSVPGVPVTFVAGAVRQHVDVRQRQIAALTFVQDASTPTFERLVV